MTADWRCEICGAPVPEYQPSYCCDGFECACHGQPLDPCVDSEHRPYDAMQFAEVAASIGEAFAAIGRAAEALPRLDDARKRWLYGRMRERLEAWRWVR